MENIKFLNLKIKGNKYNFQTRYINKRDFIEFDKLIQLITEDHKEDESEIKKIYLTLILDI
ncbi:hypothetical protein [Metaclostridioides mangenotii]|uniref:hypothetical protein n=1 Tax=Metaclostridioides mangenotii TaxID=1540 RepID=UPI000462EB0F|nr:hypothetical protein [Clostridioides mangenotii]